MSDLTKIQRLHLELIRHINMNSFDGEVIADGLIEHSDLWVSVIAAHSYHSHPVYRLFEEMLEDEWSPDTLWIVAVNRKSAKKLIDLCKAWDSEDVGIYDYSEDEELADLILDDDEELVRAWWD